MEDYIRLAALQGCHPKDFATFRRFLMLQSLRLLRRQSRIARLQQALGLQVSNGRAETTPETVLSGLAPDRPEDMSLDEAEQLQLWEELDATLTLYGKACSRLEPCNRPSSDEYARSDALIWFNAPQLCYFTISP